METDLRDVIKRSNEQRVLVKDICFSGNGEPTMSPHFSAALESAARIRDTSAPGAALVLITNGTGLLDESIFTLLKNAATGKQALAIWLKLDAGTSEWYKKMDRSAVPYNELIAKIKEFVTLAPLTIQTMLCAIDGKAPPPGEVQAWETLVLELVKTSARGPGIRSFQLYGKARPAPEDPLAESLPASYLEERAASLRTALTGAGLKKGSGETIPVEVFY
jgi:histidinol dehydrogenase